jgi:hypothetical protein
MAEIISSDVALLVTFNQAIDGVLKNNKRPGKIPRPWRNSTATSAGW